MLLEKQAVLRDDPDQPVWEIIKSYKKEMKLLMNNSNIGFLLNLSAYIKAIPKNALFQSLWQVFFSINNKFINSNLI
jgi:hypothetical protein